MTIKTGQPASAKTFNDAFLSKTEDNEYESILNLNAPDSGVQVSNAQQQINNNKDNIEDHETRLQASESSLDINSLDEKEEPVATDFFLVEDSENGNAKVKVSIGKVLGGGGGGGGSTAWIKGDISPETKVLSGFDVFSFSSNDQSIYQSIFLNVIVPSSYNQGDLVKLKNTRYFSEAGGNYSLLRCKTTLIKTGDTYSDETNVHTSTNSEIELLLANKIVSIDEIDLCDSSGQINGVDIEAGDILKVEMYRDFDNESIIADEDLNFLKYSSSVSFKD